MKRNNQEKRTQSNGAGDGGSRGRRGLSLGGRVGRGLWGTGARRQWGWCAWRVEAPGHKGPRAMLRTSRPPGPEPFHFLHVLTNLGFLCRIWGDWVFVVKNKWVTIWTFMENVLERGEGRVGETTIRVLREVRAWVETQQGERMEPLSICVWGGGGIETAGRADGLNVECGG